MRGRLQQYICIFNVPAVDWAATKGLVSLGVAGIRSSGRDISFAASADSAAAAQWFRTDMIPHLSAGPLARLFACSLAPRTHLLAPHCLLCLSTPLRSFVRSFVHSLTPELVRKWMIWCLKTTWFCPTVRCCLRRRRRLENTWRGWHSESRKGCVRMTAGSQDGKNQKVQGKRGWHQMTTDDNRVKARGSRAVDN